MHIDIHEEVTQVSSVCFESLSPEVAAVHERVQIRAYKD